MLNLDPNSNRDRDELELHSGVVSPGFSPKNTSVIMHIQNQVIEEGEHAQIKTMPLIHQKTTL